MKSRQCSHSRITHASTTHQSHPYSLDTRTNSRPHQPQHTHSRPHTHTHPPHQAPTMPSHTAAHCISQHRIHTLHHMIAVDTCAAMMCKRRLRTTGDGGGGQGLNSHSGMAMIEPGDGEGVYVASEVSMKLRQSSHTRLTNASATQQSQPYSLDTHTHSRAH